MCVWSLYFQSILALATAFFFCLALVHALSKTFGFSPSVNSQLKKYPKLTVCHMDQSFHATCTLKD